MKLELWRVFIRVTLPRKTSSYKVTCFLSITEIHSLSNEKGEIVEVSIY